MSDRLKNEMKTAFDKVHAEEALKQNTREFLRGKTRGYRSGNAFWQRRLAPALVCLCLVILGIGGYFFYVTPVSAICIEVNPVIELGINRFDKVVSVKGQNEDGCRIAESLDLMFCDYGEALDALLADKSLEAYVMPGNTVSITVVGRNEEENREMLNHVHAHASVSHNNVHCDSGNAGEVEAAREAGMSIGEYKAFLELQSLDPAVTLQDVQGLSAHEIRSRVNALLDEKRQNRRNGSGKRSDGEVRERRNQSQDDGYGSHHGHGHGDHHGQG